MSYGLEDQHYQYEGWEKDQDRLQDAEQEMARAESHLAAVADLIDSRRELAYYKEQYQKLVDEGQRRMASDLNLVGCILQHELKKSTRP